MRLCGGRVRQFGPWRRRHLRTQRYARRWRGGFKAQRRRLRQRRAWATAKLTEIAFNHRQPVDDMTESAVNGFEGILGVAVSLGLVETDVRQLALDDADKITIRELGVAAAALRKRGKHSMLLFEMAQN